MNALLNVGAPPAVRPTTSGRVLPKFVTPEDVADLQHRLDSMVRELDQAAAVRTDLPWCTIARWRRFAAAWTAYVRQGASWFDAAAQLARGHAYERDVERWRVLLAGDAGREHLTGQDPGLHLAWPSLVIDYHRMWTPYVAGTARAASECAQLPPPPYTHQTQELWTQGLQEDADSIMIAWNIHAGAPASDILLFAAQFLEDFQNTVKRVGDFYQPHLRKYCPSIALPDPPPFEIQNPVVSAIEDAEIVAKGVIEILGIATDGTLEVLGRAAQAVGHRLDKALGAAPLVAGAVLLVGLGVMLKR